MLLSNLLIEKGFPKNGFVENSEEGRSVYIDSSVLEQLSGTGYFKIHPDVNNSSNFQGIDIKEIFKPGVICRLSPKLEFIQYKRGSTLLSRVSQAYWAVKDIVNNDFDTGNIIQLCFSPAVTQEMLSSFNFHNPMVITKVDIPKMLFAGTWNRKYFEISPVFFAYTDLIDILLIPKELDEQGVNNDIDKYISIMDTETDEEISNYLDNFSITYEWYGNTEQSIVSTGTPDRPSPSNSFSQIRVDKQQTKTNQEILSNEKMNWGERILIFALASVFSNLFASFTQNNASTTFFITCITFTATYGLVNKIAYESKISFEKVSFEVAIGVVTYYALRSFIY